MDSYSEQRFRSTIDNALQRVRTVLENNRSPQIPANVSHTYEGTQFVVPYLFFSLTTSDKYLLAELLTNTALGAQVNSFEFLGLTAKNIDQILEWGQNRTGVI
jgi:hypothetical protein